MSFHVNRRDFIKTVGAAAVLSHQVPVTGEGSELAEAASLTSMSPQALDLSPAHWIWYPSQRTLANTFFLFRRSVHLSQPVKKATGWIAVDSRYKLYLNGEYLQFGPAPCDPRWLEADPIDLTAGLNKGENVLGVQALYYGFGDGTWPIGKPGFIFLLEIEEENGNRQTIISDDSWRVFLARAWRPGQYKRWYLRSLQEEFDSRLYPYGWNTVEFVVDDRWLQAMMLKGHAYEPALNASYSDYMLDVSGSRGGGCQLRQRSVPLMKETPVGVDKLSEAHLLEWRTDINDYFEFLTPNAFRTMGRPEVTDLGAHRWRVQSDGTNSIALTFEFSEQVVGWPFFTIRAEAGTVVELLVHEAHQIGGPALINSHFNSWTRFICRQGENTFTTFDFESLRWLQLHIHGPAGRVDLSEIGVLRRVYPWPHPAQVRCSEPNLQRLFGATVNTLHNCCQETMVDGMARERQQYSGDCGHQIHAVALTFGEQRLLARYLNTYSQGMTLDGYFLDCWPAYDRLARLMERQLHLTGWGPILDHGIGFNFDCYYYYLYTGDLTALQEPFPRLLKFFDYLKRIRTQAGLLPVENLGIPSVWIDHVAYQKQRHKQCAFNLYAAAMMEHGLKPLCHAMGDHRTANEASQVGGEILRATVRAFWSESHALFINNLPWLQEEKHIRTCDRSLATAVLYDQCPFGQNKAAVAALADCPEEMGFSYPANAGWRLWALAKAGRGDLLLKDLRERWASMASVLLNNTLQEDWEVKPDSSSQWSHCPVVPLYILQMNLVGVQVLEPGAKKIRIWPQLAGLQNLDTTLHTALGPIHFRTQGQGGKRNLSIRIPAAMEAEIWLDPREKVSLAKSRTNENGTISYRLPEGKESNLTLKYA